MQTLTTPRVNVEEYNEVPHSARGPAIRCTALNDQKKFVESLASKSHKNTRQPKMNYSSLGAYRPHMRNADEVLAEGRQASKAEKGEGAEEFEDCWGL
jgi:hypothetical protein